MRQINNWMGAKASPVKLSKKLQLTNFNLHMRKSLYLILIKIWWLFENNIFSFRGISSSENWKVISRQTVISTETGKRRNPSQSPRQIVSMQRSRPGTVQWPQHSIGLHVGLYQYMYTQIYSSSVLSILFTGY